jgi:hypothetical protein
MSGNLNLPQLVQNQAAPEVTANTALAQLDAALTEIVLCDGTSGNVTVTQGQYRAAARFSIINVSVARTVTLPAIKREVTVDVAAANVGVATLVVGSTQIVLVAGNAYFIYTDGTANGLVILSAGIMGVQVPYDLAVFISGTMVNAQELLRMNAVRPFTLPVSLTGSIAKAGISATGSTTVTLNKNGSSIGTLVWSAAGTLAAITFAAAVTFATGDVFTITGPATFDATLANIGIDLKGSR